jgi:hypothetical protein
MKMAAEMGLNRMGDNDNEDDNDEDDATEDTTGVAPIAATPKVAAEEVEDPEMLILEWEPLEALEVILPDEEPELL